MNHWGHLLDPNHPAMRGGATDSFLDRLGVRGLLRQGIESNRRRRLINSMFLRLSGMLQEVETLAQEQPWYWSSLRGHWSSDEENLYSQIEERIRSRVRTTDDLEADEAFYEKATKMLRDIMESWPEPTTVLPNFDKENQGPPPPSATPRTL